MIEKTSKIEGHTPITPDWISPRSTQTLQLTIINF